MWLWTDSWLLYLLVPLLLAWIIMWQRQSQRDRQRPALSFSSLLPVSALRPSRWQRAAAWLRWLRPAVLGILMLAIARPQVAQDAVRDVSEGVAIMLALDTSGSMQALDLDADRPLKQRRNRLDVVKDVVGTFIRQRSSDQIGMVVFGTEAFTQCPLTLDHNILNSLLENVDIGMAGPNTAIGSAIGAATKRLHNVEAKSKVIVLLTDGVNNSGKIGPIQAAEVAQALGIRIYTIGAGSQGHAPRLERHPFFGERYVNDEVDIDEDTLIQIADMTGGMYFRAEDSKGLRAIYERIDAMEKHQLDSPKIRHLTDMYPSLVAAALLLLLFELLLFNTRLRSVP